MNKLITERENQNLATPMDSSAQNKMQPAGHKIAVIAYSLWEKAGRPVGRDIEFWLEAERQINSARPDAARAALYQSEKARGGARVAPVSRARADAEAAQSTPKEWAPLLLTGDAATSSRPAANRQSQSRQRRAASA
jgi:hypothetical protein